MQLKKLLAFIIPIVLAISTSGCVDIYILKDFFEKKPPEYVWRNKDVIEENNTTKNEEPVQIPIPIPKPTEVNISATNQYTTINYTVELKKSTKKLEIKMNVAEEGNVNQIIDYLEGIAKLFSINISKLLEPYAPYVNITIYSPNGDVKKQNETKYNATWTYLIEEENLALGKWRIFIEKKSSVINATILNYPSPISATWALTSSYPIASAYEIK